MRTPIKKRTVFLNGRKTAVSLENDFWDALREIAESESKTVSQLLGELARARRQNNFSSAIRLYVLSRYRRER